MITHDHNHRLEEWLIFPKLAACVALIYCVIGYYHCPVMSLYYG